VKARIIQGDARDELRNLPDSSVRCVITSPPYFGLRDYGNDGQIGHEATLGEYVSELVSVFREARRVLADDGTLWLNLGDSYARKNLIGVPWRVAFALQADGWWLRQDIIWHKPNPMPESVRDRCTKAHEYVFLLSKNPRYHFDAEAIAEPLAESSMKAGAPRFGGTKYGDNDDPLYATKSGNPWEPNKSGLRNKRSVWTVAPRPYAGAHFATFPPDLVRPCILAGSSPGDTILDPFNGSGTTGQVALEYGRRYVGIELNPEYVELTNARLAPILAQPGLSQEAT